jgi:hypothetical protein
MLRGVDPVARFLACFVWSRAVTPCVFWPVALIWRFCALCVQTAQLSSVDPFQLRPLRPHGAEPFMAFEVVIKVRACSICHCALLAAVKHGLLVRIPCWGELCTVGVSSLVDLAGTFAQCSDPHSVWPICRISHRAGRARCRRGRAVPPVLYGCWARAAGSCLACWVVPVGCVACRRNRHAWDLSIDCRCAGADISVCTLLFAALSV